MQSNNDEDLLQFKDYANTPGTSSPPAQINVNSPTNSKRQRGDPLADLIYDMSKSAQNLDANAGNMSSSGGAANVRDFGADSAGADNTTGKASFLSLEYYQQFFNVDTYMVVERIANSMIPRRADKNYLFENIGTNPDLYGPFWITITLIFSIAISGNIASYLQHSNDDYHWHYNFRLVSYASTCIFLYANILPAVIWAIFKYSPKTTTEGGYAYTPSLLSIMCIYGYSLSIYIPVSILWVIQISLLQWLLVITAAFLSGIVLISVLQPALVNSNLSFFLRVTILVAHFVLAAGFMLYFFHVPSNSSAPLKVTTTTSPKPQHLEKVTQAALNLLKSSVNHTAIAGNIDTPK